MMTNVTRKEAKGLIDFIRDSLDLDGNTLLRLRKSKVKDEAVAKFYGYPHGPEEGRVLLYRQYS